MKAPPGGTSAGSPNQYRRTARHQPPTKEGAGLHATDGISGREERPPEEARVRDRVLTALLAEGGTADLASLHEVSGLSLETLEDAALYLDGEELVRVESLDSPRPRLAVSLTGTGKELAQSLADRREP
jgi:hypothetical protein